MAQTIYEAPPTKAFAITPNDGADLAIQPRAIYVGGAGNITMILADDTSSVAFNGATAGSILPFRVKKVFATGTTATVMVGLY